MNFFTKKMTWTNAEFIPFKVCIAAAYLYIGTSYPTLFSDYRGLLLGLFVVSLALVMGMWVKKMRG
ncbi:MAG: hypothetical protein RJB36_108 [Bacteroidota bacterium]|jgi:hypothetical protein